LAKNSALTHGLRLPQWDVSLSLEFMERNDISTAILSLPIPPWILCKDASEAQRLARAVNTIMSDLQKERKEKFGFFGCLPNLDDRQACIDEIRYAMSHLGAKGIMLFSSYGGKYLGHPDFEPVWEELAARGATVFIHPTMEGAEQAIQEPTVIPRPLCDWPHETTRTALHLVTTGTLRKYGAKCRFILSHGGGTLPYIAGRAADLGMQMRMLEGPPGAFLEACREFYFDVALAGYKGPLQLLLNFAAPGHVLYGSDFPFAQASMVANQATDIAEVMGLQGTSLFGNVFE
jgi:predicted TIM-barrel fold metal-dependent hydrolase